MEPRYRFPGKPFWLLIWWGFTLLAACSPPPATPIAPSPASLPLQACVLSSPGVPSQVEARCGKLSVKEDPQATGGRQISLNVAVLPATAQDARPDPLFLIAGGPGQAATEAFLPILPAFSLIRANRDLVLVDQRGTGQSNPLQCPEIGDGSALSGSGSKGPEPSGLIKACLDQLDADPRFYTTVNAIQDLDRVRQEMGYERINLYGVSYGTRVALAYLRAYPEHVRAVILDGVVPPDWPLGPETASDAQQALDKIFLRCAQDTACHAAFPDLSGDLATLLDSLSAPVRVDLLDPTSGDPVQMLLDREKAASTIHLLSYTQENAALLPLLIHTVATSGDDHLLAAQSLLIAQPTETGVASGMYLSVLCAEDVPFYPAATAAPRSYLPEDLATLQKICSQWPHTNLPASYFAAVHSDQPVLLLSGEADPITPPANAQQAARTLTNSLQLVIPGAGHNVIFRGCIPRIAADFLQAASLAGLDTSCVERMLPTPFFLNFSGPQP